MNLRMKKNTHVKNTRSMRMKLTTLTAATAALAVTLAFAQSAQAREHHYRHSGYYRHGVSHAVARYASTHRYAPAAGQNYASENYYSDWTEQNNQWRWRYQRSAAEAFAWSTHAARRGRSGATSDDGDRMAYHGGIGPRPRAWCGWQMRQLVGSDPGPEYNLARNWARWGHTGPAGVGAVVVWAHHVGKIVGQQNGQWIIESGNDGNRVRTRPLSISRAIAIRWG
jgi:hypothetical protein